MDYKMCESICRDRAQREAEDRRIFAVCFIGLVLGIALMMPGTGLILLSEKVITTGLWHSILNAGGKLISLSGLVIMLGCSGWAMVQDLK